MKRFALALLVLAVLATPARAEVQRYAIIIGNNIGSKRRTPLRFAESDAKKMFAVLTAAGHFSQRDTVLHLGASANEVWQSLQRTERTLERRAAKGAARSLLLIYYSGHASRTALELGASTLPFAKLRAFIKRCKATVRVAVIDACQSGQLVASKGGTPGPGYRISLADHMSSKGYAIITSSTESELSQESAAVRGSTFTHHFVSALRGAADDSGDDKVTLDEAYRYAYSRTVAHTAAQLGGGQHPMYDFKLSGRGDIVLTQPKTLRSGLRFRARRGGRLLVLSKDRERVIGEFAARSGAALRVALRPGDYWVYLVARRNVLRGKVSVRADQLQDLGEAALSRFTPRTSVAKGGLFAPAPMHRVSGGFLVRRMPLDGAVLAFGGALSYGIEFPNDLQPAITITAATAPDAGLSEGYFEVGAHLGASYTWLRAWRQRLAFYVELRAGYELLGQAKRDDQARYTSSFSYFGGAGVRFPIASRLGAQIGGGAGGRLFELRGQGWQHRLDLQAVASLLWQWSFR
ncbi:MAG: caspase family protein [Myxococcales bacterium]|nr:caspase family protein [Myxococcales bacterium]